MLSAAEHDFVNAMGDRLSTWQLPRATGRVYGYLLLRDEPSTSEQLRADLALSSGAVSTATRALVSWGLATTVPQPGSRRLLVEATGGFEQLLAASHARTRLFISTLEGAHDLTDSPRAATRLREVTTLFRAYLEAGERSLQSFRRPPPTR